jgi:hypothetical protein
MTPPRKTAVWEWLFCLAVLFVGLFFLFVYEFNRQHGTTAEDDLTLAEGVADPVLLPQSGKTQSLLFTVAGLNTDYASDRPHFAAVLAAVQSGKPIRIWISTRQETLVPRSKNWATLYKLSVGDRPVLRYAEVVEHQQKGATAALIVGCAIVGISIFGMLAGIRKNRVYLAWERAMESGEPLPEQAAGPEDLEKKVTRTSIIVSLLIYAVVIGVNYDPKVRAKFAEAFGAEPLGLPVSFVVAVIETLLYLPMPWVFWHGMRLTFRALEEGRRPGIGYLLTVGFSHPELRRSQVICLGGLVYFFLICGVWIAYAAARGI